MEEIGLKTMKEAGMNTYKNLTQTVKDLAKAIKEG